MENQNARILIVDDNPKNLQVLGSILKNVNLKSGFALNGMDAINMLNKTPFDLILLDVNMPGIDGFETCKQIRMDPKFVLIPIIFLTAEVDPDSIVRGLETGGQDYITKPFNPEELIARVNTQLELKWSREQLKSMNSLLEQKIIDRTLELQDANTKLEAANKSLIELDKAKFEFLQLISHEIRTPLNGIKGFTELMKLEEVSEDFYNYIHGLEESVNRLSEFSLNALLYTSLNTGNYSFEKDTIRISDLIERTCESLADKLNEKNIELIINSNGEPSIYGDLELFEICFDQTIGNAVQHTPSNSEIRIDTYLRDDSVFIDVLDQGPGFSDHAMKSLFTPFAAAGMHTDKKEGLGLATIKLIVEAHNGSIEISNIQPRGSLVRISILTI